MTKRGVTSGAGKSSAKRSFVFIVMIFSLFLAGLYFAYNQLSELSPEERVAVKLPRNLDDARALGKVLHKYKNIHYYQVTFTFFFVFIFLQTFVIPGSIFLSILSGFLYPFHMALFLVCLSSGIGATGCYLISMLVGKPIVDKYFKQRTEQWKKVVDDQRDNLFFYILFLRITPFLPNWFINVVSPIIDIPISTFFVSTAIGVAPLSFIAIQGGTTLNKMITTGEAWSWTSVSVVAALALLSMLPPLLKKYTQKPQAAQTLVDNRQKAE